MTALSRELKQLENDKATMRFAFKRIEFNLQAMKEAFEQGDWETFMCANCDCDEGIQWMQALMNRLYPEPVMMNGASSQELEQKSTEMRSRFHGKQHEAGVCFDMGLVFPYPEVGSPTFHETNYG